MTKAGLLNKGYHLLTTLTLENLYTQQTPMTGTLRAKRKGVPNLLKDAKPKEQECAYFRKGDLLALSWREQNSPKPLSDDYHKGISKDG